MRTRTIIVQGRPQARRVLEPAWVGLLHFEGMRRLPSALAG
jgi:hypothetical protein